MKVRDKNVEKSLKKLQHELNCAKTPSVDSYARMKIEKSLAIVETLLDIIEFE